MPRVQTRYLPADRSNEISRDETAADVLNDHAAAAL